MTSTLRLGAMALASALALVGCSGDNLAENALENALENELGGDANVDLDGDGITVETTDGTIQVGGGASLPDGWPTDIPTPDGLAIVTSQRFSSDDDTVWSVAFQGDGTASDIAASLKSAFVAAGFTIDGEFSQSGSDLVSESFQATRGDLTVNVGITQASGEPVTVTLTATQQAPAS